MLLGIELLKHKEFMMKSLTLAGLLFGSALIAAGGPNMPTYESYDADRDGRVTQNEFENARAKRMQERSEENRMMRNAENAPAFKDLDKNGNGYMERHEFEIHQQNMMRENRGMGQGQGMGRGMGQGQGMGKGR